jgi:hypothetical protein
MVSGSGKCILDGCMEGWRGYAGTGLQVCGANTYMITIETKNENINYLNMT